MRVGIDRKRNLFFYFFFKLKFYSLKYIYKMRVEKCCLYVYKYSLFAGHIYCSGLFLALLRDHSWWSSGDHLGYQGLNFVTYKANALLCCLSWYLLSTLPPLETKALNCPAILVMKVQLLILKHNLFNLCSHLIRFYFSCPGQVGTQFVFCVGRKDSCMVRIFC